MCVLINFDNMPMRSVWGVLIITQTTQHLRRFNHTLAEYPILLLYIILEHGFLSDLFTL